MRLLIEQRGEQRARGERLAGLIGVAGVPPDPAALAIPAGRGDVCERALGVGEPAPRSGCAVGVHERKTPPAVVVEPGLGVRAAVARIGREAGHRAQPAVQVALGAGGEARDGVSVGLRRRGDGQRVDRLEQRHDVPDRGQRIAVAVAQARVVPAPPRIAPALLGTRDAALRERQVVLLDGGQRRGGGRRRRLRGSPRPRPDREGQRERERREGEYGSPHTID